MGGLTRLVDAALAWMTPKRCFVYALVLFVMSHMVGVAFYLYLPRCRETTSADFVRFYSAAPLTRSDPDKLYDPKAQKQIQLQLSPGARLGSVRS